MATYTQWRAATDKGDLRRVTWVCGDQPVLVEEVVDSVRGTLAATDLNYVTLTGGVDTDRQIWAAAHQYPLVANANRLVLVRRAEKITRWAPLTNWFAQLRLLPRCYLLFIASEPDFPYTVIDGKRGPLPGHIELIKTKGRIVRCAAPNDADAVTWARRRALSLDELTARYLLRRTGGDLTAAAAVCAKLSLLPGTPGPVTIDHLADEIPALSFVDNLLSGDKRAALQTGAELSEREFLRIIALLDSRLDLLATLWHAGRAGLDPADVLGHPSYLVRGYFLIARDYPPKRCVYRRRVLAVCEEAVKSGAKTGVREALVALW